MDRKKFFSSKVQLPVTSALNAHDPTLFSFILIRFKVLSMRIPSLIEIVATPGKIG